MTDLERRALLGDREAQEECTRLGIVLPCPFCGSKRIITSNWGMFRSWCTDCKSKSDDMLSAIDALRSWNTRAAPPIGRCETCAGKARCILITEGGFGDDDYCSAYEPKEEKKS